jgi:hypothetical protein
MSEYVMYMIRNSGALDPDTIAAYEAQFHALDADGGGAISLDRDFCVSMLLKCVFYVQVQLGWTTSPRAWR